MMENTITLTTEDNKKIDVITNGDSKKIIIFVHGLTGGKQEHALYNAARFFPSHGFMTARFNLYGYSDKERKLEECTITIHAKDLNIVINHFKEKDIYLVGHSLGGPTILLADTKKVKKIVLWDPSLTTKQLKERYTYCKELDLYYAKRRYIHMVNKEMMQEFEKDNWVQIINQTQIETKIIFAENYEYAALKEQINKPYTIIKGATHGFDEEGAEEKLFEETLKFIQ